MGSWIPIKQLLVGCYYTIDILQLTQCQRRLLHGHPNEDSILALYVLNSHLEVVGTRLETCGAKNGQVLPLAIIVKACHLNTSIVKLRSTAKLIPVRTERLLCWTTSSPIGG